MKKCLRRRASFVLLLFTAAVFSTIAQTPAPQAAAAPASDASTPPAFEVASVRLGDPHPPMLPPGTSPISRFPTSHFFAHNTNLKLIIAVAFGIDENNIDAGPGWLESDNYTIDAKVEGDQKLTHEQIEPLLQGLLAQRFGLKVHHESKLGAGFELVIAKGGPKLTPAHGHRPWFQIFPDSLQGWDGSIDTLAHILASPVGQPVIDHTGLAGFYDITLKYAPPNNPDPNSNLPDIFTAIQDQLGLKLVPAKVPVDYLVIDHVDRVPTEN